MNRSRPAAVHTLTRADAGRRRTVRTVGQTGDRMPDAHGRGRPSATRAGHRHAQPIQQAPQPHTASCAPAMLYTDAARMARLVGDDHRATAPGTRGVSSGIHEDTVSPLHDRRERSPYARVLTPGGGAGLGVVFGYRACSAELGRSGPRWRRQRHRARWGRRNGAPEPGGPQCHLPHQRRRTGPARPGRSPPRAAAGCRSRGRARTLAGLLPLTEHDHSPRA
jgi:hypothetical protein